MNGTNLEVLGIQPPVASPVRSTTMRFTHMTCGDDRFTPMVEAAAGEFFRADRGAGVLKVFVASNCVIVESIAADSI